MKQSFDWGNAALGLTLLLSVAGCNKSMPTPANETQAPPAKPTPANETQAPPAKPAAPSGKPSVALNPKTDLRTLALYLQKHDKAGLLPAKLEDLPELKRDLPQVYQAIQDGAYVVSWGVPHPAQVIIAYERDAPSKGGVVLAGDGSTRVLSAEEFQTAPKGGK